MAGNLGFQVFLLSDATATFERTDLRGKHWDAEEIHALSLANMHREYATVITTPELHSRNLKHIWL
jgi:nicotinamidase-related amidase